MKVGIARNARGLTPRISLKNLQVSSVRFQHQKVNPPSEENKPANADAPKKRRPLSRVAIGGSQDHERKYAKGTIEFAAWKAILVLFGAGGLATWWFQREKERIRIQKEVESKRGIGKPLIGGPFSLVDTENKPFTNLDLVGDKFSILYFGFTHCPDVCPDELDKLGEVLDTLKKDNNTELQPVFITCDPARDSPEVVKQYLTDFHPSIIGLTGSYENVKNACKKYRVYFSTPPDVKPGQDYLVDHSIFFYLMDPEGNFVDVIGREATATEAVEKIRLHIDAFVPKEEMERRKDSWLSFLYK